MLSGPFVFLNVMRSLWARRTIPGSWRSCTSAFRFTSIAPAVSPWN